MPTSLTPQEAAAALAQVETTQAAMRRSIRDHRGHYYLWIWGAAWVAMPLMAHFGGDHAARHFPAICLVGTVLSMFTGFMQSGQIRRPVNARFVGALATLWLFGAVAPFVLRAPFDPRTLYAYCCLIAMQTYVVAGLWTDTYLLWVGLVVTALVLLGVFCFPGIFWLWMAIFGGGTLIGTGFYVRHCWK